MRSDSLSLSEEVSQLSTSTSRGVFPQQLRCEREPVFSVSSGMDPERPCLKEGPISCSGVNSGSSFIPQDEDMSESHVETLEKAVGVSVIWTGDLTSL